MRLASFPVFAALLLPLALPAQSKGPTPVLVELFTSEGCSSCPPADALLGRLDKEQPIAGAEIIVLEEHVDYWENLGWHDRFSSPQFTERQKAYGSRFHLGDVFTPQMVVGGVKSFVGSDAGLARNAIHQAAQTDPIRMELSGLTIDGRRLSGVIAGERIPPATKGDLYAALVDPTQTTVVSHGENGGKTLHHTGVVRVLKPIGSLKDFARGPVAFTLEGSAPVEGQRLVIFAQAPAAGPILGAVAHPIGQTPPKNSNAGLNLSRKEATAAPNPQNENR